VAPLASVIVPTFNGAHLLPNCLDSLVRQTYSELEVIFADGASTDATPDVLANRYQACACCGCVAMAASRAT
jgi:glycosyltransferase involved in cell wall biosynthesis